MQMRCWEIRREAWLILWKDRWFWRFLGVSVLLGLAGFAANQALISAYEYLQIAHWGEYLGHYLNARLGNDLLQVPSRETALRMSAATGASVVLGWIFSGCAQYGESLVLLRAVRGRGVKWMDGIWQGFRAPFTHLALMLISLVTAALVSVCIAVLLALVTNGRCVRDLLSFVMMIVLLQVPMLITWLYFQPLWFVRAEHPDWGPCECLAEARRLMKGHRYALFRLLQSYWALPLATLAVLLVMGFPVVLPYALPFLLLGALPFYLIVPWHMRTGVAVFWREILAAQESPQAAEL